VISGQFAPCGALRRLSPLLVKLSVGWFQVGSFQFSVFSGLISGWWWPSVSGQWPFSVISGQWQVVGDQWPFSVISGQWQVVGEQATMYMEAI